jgi:phage gp37-like protein
MLSLKDIEDALIADAKANISGVKTVETHEKEFDAMVLSALLPRTPFIFIRYNGTTPAEDERRADNAAGISGREFVMTVGAESLRTRKDAQRGAYDLLDALRERYNGLALAVGAETIIFYYDGDRWIFTSDSLVAYQIFFKWDEN